MGEVRTATGVDLGDLSGSGFSKIETDVIALVAALKVLCREQVEKAGLTLDQFAKALRKDALPEAVAAILAAAADFFPTKVWSEVLSRFEKTKAMRAGLMDLISAAALVDDQALPETLRFMVANEIQKEIDKVTTSAKSPVNESATGPANTPSTPAIDSPVSAE